MAHNWDETGRSLRFHGEDDGRARLRTLSEGLYDHPRGSSKFADPDEEEVTSPCLDSMLREPRAPVFRDLNHKQSNHGFAEPLAKMYPPPFLDISHEDEPKPPHQAPIDLTRNAVHGDRCGCGKCRHAPRPPAANVMHPGEPKAPEADESTRLPGSRQTLAELGIGQDEAGGRDLGFDSWSEEKQRESILPRNATLSIGDVAALLHTTSKYAKQLIQEGVLPRAPYVTAGKHRRWTRRHLDALQHVADKLDLLESRRMSKVQRERLRKLSHAAFDEIAEEQK